MSPRAPPYGLALQLQSAVLFDHAHGYEVVNTRGDLTIGLLPPAGSPPVEWLVSDGPVAYDAALAIMAARAAAIARGEARELVWLLEHPALYTAGTSSQLITTFTAPKLTR